MHLSCAFSSVTRSGIPYVMEVFMSLCEYQRLRFHVYFKSLYLQIERPSLCYSAACGLPGHAYITGFLRPVCMKVFKKGGWVQSIVTASRLQSIMKWNKQVSLSLSGKTQMCGVFLTIHLYLTLPCSLCYWQMSPPINWKSSGDRDCVFDYSSIDALIYPPNLCYFVSPCLLGSPSSGVGGSVNKLCQFDCYDRTLSSGRKKRHISD